jgi:hypothetical protein
LLETRRARAAGARSAPDAPRPGGPLAKLDPAWGIVPIALLWANAHISYYLGFVLRRGPTCWTTCSTAARAAGPVCWRSPSSAAALASFANPFGWRALAQPLEYFTVWRTKPIYQSIGELAPTIQYLDMHVRDGLLAWLVVVVLAALVRWRTRGFDDGARRCSWSSASHRR